MHDTKPTGSATNDTKPALSSFTHDEKTASAKNWDDSGCSWDSALYYWASGTSSNFTYDSK